MAKANRICSIPDCNKPAKARGWCNPHYMSWFRNGDPLAKKWSWGEAREWIKAHASHTGEECIKWPFARNELGYGTVRMENGVKTKASRAMCILVHGEPPAPDYEAAHSCGKGHEGCVNPRHLRWATRRENASDRKLHGTEPFGEAHPQSKLTEDAVMEIRRLAGVVSQRELAGRFGVCQQTVSEVHRRLIWTHLP